MASVTEIIQKADGLDFTTAESLSKNQMKIFAYNNIGKFNINSRFYLDIESYDMKIL